jgi:hypothetical protein
MHVTLRSLTRRMRCGVILTAAFVVVATVAVGPAQADSANRGGGGRRE